MTPIAGIDLGTTNSLIGVVDSGFPVLIADRDGERLTPSVVHFPASGDPVVGRPAARLRALHPADTVSSVKRLMGLRGRRVAPRGIPRTPEEISSLILRKLRADAESALGQPVAGAVITVPAYFNDAQRQATRTAGEMAGFRVERILNEPTAAALAFGLGRENAPARIAVYDFGGGTFDLSILALENGVFEVLATHGNTALGGDDIDAALTRHLASEIHARVPGLESLPAADAIVLTARLREAATAAKHRLSSADETSVDLPFLDGARSVSLPLSRADLERIAAPVVQQTVAHCRQALADAKLAPGDLDAVLLVGGSTRMPAVRRLAAEIFGREPDTSQHPDEAVALGATIQAGILAGAIRHTVLLDVTPLSLGIETFGGLMNVLIPRNSTIPCKAGEMFTNAAAGQRQMRIRILQGERELAADNWELGRFDLDFEAAPRGHARVGVQFEIDADGILHVLARDTRTGLERAVEIRSATDVADAAVEEMIAGSVENAFADMTARQLAEQRLKADELLPAVRRGLDLVGHLLPEAERARINALAGSVRAAAEAGNLAELKGAVAALDEATEGLAALLLEQTLGDS